MGLAFPALMTLATSTAMPSDAGLVSGLVNTTAQVGGALGALLGLAVLLTVTVLEKPQALVAAPEPDAAASAEPARDAVH